jgi:hypothetical protein
MRPDSRFENVWKKPMSTASARITVAASFVAISVLGAGFVFSYWVNESIGGAAGRSILFVIIMASVHVAGYLLYVEQTPSIRSDAISAPPRASFEFAPHYSPATKDAIILQLVFGVLTALMLDGD